MTTCAPSSYSPRTRRSVGSPASFSASLACDKLASGDWGDLYDLYDLTTVRH